MSLMAEQLRDLIHTSEQHGWSAQRSAPWLERLAAEAAVRSAEQAEIEGAVAQRGAAAGTDQSGRRQMGKRIETFQDAPQGFAYLKLQDGQLRFRNQEVLRGVTWDVQTGQRVGLVGNNGAGKTTQLRVLAEELELDGGELIKSAPDIKIAFLRQEFREDLRDSRTLKQEFISAFGKVQRLEEEYAEAEKALASAGDDADEIVGPTAVGLGGHAADLAHVYLVQQFK
jgi:ABC-type glutathione transport system ATPase component